MEQRTLTINLKKEGCYTREEVIGLIDKIYKFKLVGVERTVARIKQELATCPWYRPFKRKELNGRLVRWLEVERSHHAAA
jgi:hypothetical protein